MPVYRYTHTCGLEQRIFLKENKESIIVPCYRCGRNVTATQVRDKKMVIGEADGVTGILERDAQNRNRRR